MDAPGSLGVAVGAATDGAAWVVMLCVAVGRGAAVGATTVETEDVGVRSGSTGGVGVGLGGIGVSGVTRAVGMAPSTDCVAVAAGSDAAGVSGCVVLVGVGVGVDRVAVAVGDGPPVPVAVGVGVCVGVGMEDGTGVCVGGYVVADGVAMTSAETGSNDSVAPPMSTLSSL